MEFALQALLPLVAYNMLLAAALTNGNSMLFYAFLVMMVVLGAFYYYYVMCRRLPGMVREVLRMEGKKRSDVPK